MRIGYYIPGWPPGSVPNGIVTTLGHLGRKLRDMGHQVFYITPVVPSDSNDKHVTALAPFERRSALESLRFKWDLESALHRRHSNAIANAVVELIEKEHIEIF